MLQQWPLEKSSFLNSYRILIPEIPPVFPIVQAGNPDILHAVASLELEQGVNAG